MIENLQKQGNFSWRYFHFIDTAGTRINVIEHETDIFGLEKNPYMTMVIKNPGLEPVRLKGESNVIWERNLVEKSGEFEFVCQNVRFIGTVSEALHYKDFADILLYQDSMGRESHWAVDVPYGKIKGTLTTPHEEKQINGYMYQDRQWGDIPLQEWIKDWTWAHLANKDLFVIIFCINTMDGKKSWHAISGQGEEVSLNNNFQVSGLPELTEAKNPTSNIFRVEIKIPGKSPISFSLQPEDIMRLRMDEKHPDFSANYIRWSIKGSSDQSTDPMQGIAEYIKIEKL
jgi:hypothetical protein